MRMSMPQVWFPRSSKLSIHTYHRPIPSKSKGWTQSPSNNDNVDLLPPMERMSPPTRPLPILVHPPRRR
ncbi:hypothetical protein PILCRDRAFT_812799 [Piloderma croceum F 1598]|uniref:Uncharacterized protein n=1 Tax=Piloderma croceum (strain F 1598) TaxID=765440 RepID=A0A0C3CJU0_PILCF|nr:hypothetical protein PILCRDRAFT_812799 [Piloderma croceum F 1598]